MNLIWSDIVFMLMKSMAFYLYYQNVCCLEMCSIFGLFHLLMSETFSINGTIKIGLHLIIHFRTRILWEQFY